MHAPTRTARLLAALLTPLLLAACGEAAPQPPGKPDVISWVEGDWSAAPDAAPMAFDEALWGKPPADVIAAQALYADSYREGTEGAGYLPRLCRVFGENAIQLYHFREGGLYSQAFQFAPAEEALLDTYREMYARIVEAQGDPSGMDLRKLDDGESFDADVMTDEQIVSLIRDRNGALLTFWHSATTDYALVLFRDKDGYDFDQSGPVIVLTLNPVREQQPPTSEAPQTDVQIIEGDEGIVSE